LKTNNLIRYLETIRRFLLETFQRCLTTLDAKIELNDRINAELEAMAKTLYDYWFVQFDFPDANGKPYKTSGGKMVYNAELKRDVPEGWQWKPIEKLIDVRDGTHESPKPSRVS
jgi:type I restriction enzyme S subunit